MALRYTSPYFQWIDGDGVPAAGWFLAFYASGTSTPLATYADSGLTIANSNPVEANSDGYWGPIYLQSFDYKVILKDADGVEIWSADPVSGGAGGGNGDIRTLRVVTTDTVVTSDDEILEVDATGGNVVITYPLNLGAPALVQPVTIIKTDTTSNTVDIIDSGAADIRLEMNQPAIGAVMQSATVYSNGTFLRILG